MKLHLLIATVAFAACSVAQAQTVEEVPLATTVWPEAPWERLDFVCRSHKTGVSDNVAFYRHPISRAGQRWVRAIGPPEQNTRELYVSGETSLAWALYDGQTDNFAFWFEIDRATGHSTNAITGENFTCVMRPANKF